MTAEGCSPTDAQPPVVSRAIDAGAGIARGGAPALHGWLFAVAMACAPLAMALVTVSFSLLALSALLRATPTTLRRTLRDSPSCAWALALFIWFGLRIVGSEAAAADAWLGWRAQHGLLVLVLLVGVPLSVAQQQRAWQAFVAGNLLAAAVAWGRFAGLVAPSMGPPNAYSPPRGPIGGAWMLALAAFACARHALTPRRHRLAAMLAAAAMLSVPLFLVAGRTAYLVMLALAALLLIGAGWRRALTGVALIAVLAAAAWTFSPHMRARVLDTFALPADAARTHSTGVRLEFYRITTALVLDAPWTGHGTGSFPDAYDRKMRALDSPGLPTGNPHNQYLFLAAETGLPGALMFIGLLIAAWREAARLKPGAGQLLRGLVLTTALACLFNSFLIDGAEGRAFVLLMALCLLGRGETPERGRQ